MPRLARLDAPGVLYHVMGRGIERRQLFLSDTDRNDFIGRLSVLAQDDAIEIYAWWKRPERHNSWAYRSPPISRLLITDNWKINRKD